MHILLVTGTFPQLSETFIFRKAVALAERGHHVQVFARGRGDWTMFQNDLPLPSTLSVTYLLPEWGLSDPTRAARLATALPMAIARAPAATLGLWHQCRGNLASSHQSWRQFIRYIPFVKIKSNVVHFEFLTIASMYPHMTHVIDAPAVVSCRGADVHLLEQRDQADQSNLIQSLRQVAAVHCVSNEMAATVTRLSGRSDGIWVNRPAIAIDRIHSKNDYTNNDCPLIIAVGRLVWKKGYDYLLAALARMKQSGIRFGAQIVGAGPLYAELRFSISDLSLESEVELLGALPPAEVLRRMQQSDVFVLSSHEEGLSNAVLEAMACGLPIVTTNAGGMAEAVSDGIEGFVVPVRDIPLLVDRITRLVDDPRLREQMGRAARQRAEAEFSIERQVKAFEDMYQGIIHRWHHPAIVT